MGIFLLLIILVPITLVMIKSTVLREVPSPPIEGTLRDVFAPVQNVCIELGRRGKELLTFPFSLFGMANRNRELTKEVAQLQGQLRKPEEYRLENERLKKLLDFRATVVSQVYGEVTTVAVIGRDPGNWFGTITLGKGSRQGIKVNMAVIVPAGLVGRIVRVSENTAQVLLITDPRSAVSALIQESRSPGLVEGLGGSIAGLRMIHIPYDTFVHPGQTVVTAGVGSFFSKGIPVGEIIDTKKDPSGLFYNATIRPYVDFDRLEEVFVIGEVKSP